MLPFPRRPSSGRFLLCLPALIVLLQLLPFPSFPSVWSVPLRPHNRQQPSDFSAHSLFRKIRQSQPMSGQRTLADEDDNIRQEHNDIVVSPPHCSRATLTVSQSSKLTKRAVAFQPNSSLRDPKFATQLGMHIGVGQSVCFTLSGQSPQDWTKQPKMSQKSSGNSEEDDDMLTAERESNNNFSLIVALATKEGQQQKPIPLIQRGRAAKNNVRARKVEPPASDDSSDNNRILHSITVLDLEQYHAITERYRFAIPEVETKCVCECESGTANCAADRYKYGRCGAEGQGDEDSDEEEGEASNSSFDSWERRQRTTNVGLRWDADKAARPAAAAPPAVCYRTFFANQPSGQHCSNRAHSSSAARLCCQLRFRPHRNRTFTALRLENAVSSVLLQYSQWLWKGRREEEAHQQNGTGNDEGSGSAAEEQQLWAEVDRRRVRVQLDGTVHNTVLSEQAGLKLSVLGLGGAKSSAAQLESGVYFAENLPDGSLSELMGQIPVNRITEHDFHKLGWFRLDQNGRPFVQSGEVFLDKIHHARAEDCVEQRFRSVLDASYYVNADNIESTQFKLAEPLSQVQKWIRSARVLDSQQRIAFVRAREGLALEVTLTARQRPNSGGGEEDELPQKQQQEQERQQRRVINFVHNSSRLADFTALLVIDRFSNSLLNLTLINASGVLNGYVRPLNDPDGTEIDGFTVNVPAVERRRGEEQPSIGAVQIRIKPYPSGSVHVVCLRPDDAELAQELCRAVQTVYHELEMNTMLNEWNSAVGHCPKCNQISAEGFAKFLNPANWVKGINSVNDFIMLATDMLAYLFVITVFYLLLTKVLIPLGCCCIGCPSCPSTLPCKKNNKK